MSKRSEHFVMPSNVELGAILGEAAPEFARIGQVLAEEGLAIGTGGNLSMRVPGGLLVTSTKSCLGEVKPDDVVFVFASESDRIFFVGPKRPSTETVTHWEIYRLNPSAAAIVHVNAGPKDDSDTLESDQELPYGSGSARSRNPTGSRSRSLVKMVS